jgi:DNA-binding transcriptional ArsR family regulator
VDEPTLEALKALTTPDRLRILGAVASRPMTADELAASLRLPLGRVVREVGVLRRAGLIEFDRGSTRPAHVLAIGRLHELGRALAALEGGAAATPSDGSAFGDVSREDAKILRAFVEDGRLTTIPAQESKRQVVLRYLLEQCFSEDRAYPEKEVNQRLALFHRDVAALRRYLVDSRLMTRSAGEYRRAAEPPEPASPGPDSHPVAEASDPAPASGTTPRG